MALDPRRVQSVFLEVVESHGPGDHAAALERICAGDRELQQRVAALLRAHQRPASLHDRPIVEPAAGHGAGTIARAVGGPEASDPTIDLAPDAAEIGAAVLAEPAGRPAPMIEGYEILGELGHGGMGVVYKGRQVQLHRPCALKMILGGAHARPESIARALAEARAIARLQHPQIVQIYHIGEVDGLPFLELEYVDGGSLDRAIDGTPWTPLRAARLVEALARAMAEAHRLGIVHRDLKPANVLLAADGTPKITDFGLAKSLEADSGLTATEAIMGSPSYMAPEQAAGQAHQLGPAADVYALGAILYELLTGRPPFKGATILETIDQTRTVDPVPPARLVPGTPKDIETIALTCLQKDPARRYPTAESMAEDLRRFGSGEAIRARPVGPFERAWRWCRRHPAPAALTAAVVLVAALGLAGILWQWDETVKARDLASRRAVAEAAARQETERTLVDMYATSGIAAGDQGEHARAALWFANAARRAVADPDRRQSNAIRARTWGRRTPRPIHALTADGSWPSDLIFHPSGRYLITANVAVGNDRIKGLALWDLESEQSLPFPGGHTTVRAATWDPEGKALAVGLEDGDVLVAGFPGGDGPARIPFPPMIRRLIYSPDGHYLAIAGGKSARVWDVRARRFATPELVHPEVVSTLAFHPDGRLLATGCLDQQARLFAVRSDGADPLWPPAPHRQWPGNAWYREFGSPPVFVNGGRELITYDGSDRLTWRAAATGEEVRSVPFPGWIKGLASIVPSPDGRYFALLGVMLPPRARLVEAATGRLVGPALEHENTILGAAFSPDGRMLATCSTDATARLWSVPGGAPLSRPLDLHRTVHLVAFDPRGRSLATQDFDLVRLWALPEEGLAMAHLPLEGKDSFAALSPDGALAIPTGMTFQGAIRSPRAYRVATGRPAGPPLAAGGPVRDAAFAPGGRSVALLSESDPSSAEGQELSVWDWARGRREWRADLPSRPRSVAYQPDGLRLAVLCGAGELLIFEAQSGRELRRWLAHEAEPAHHWVNNGKVTFSPDGRSLLTWGMGNDLRVWEPDTGRLRYAPIRQLYKCHDVQFSPDRRLMALASYDRSVRVRDLATGAIVAELPDHPDMVYSASFSPDGRLLVTTCRDRTIRVWDWRAGSLVCPPFEHAKDAVGASFTPDGRWVLSVSVEGTARAWEWRTGKPVTPPLAIPGEPLSLAVTPDGQHAVIGGGQDVLVVLDLSALAPTADDPDALCRWAELLAGQRLHEGGGTVNLSAGEWLERWQVFRRSPAGAARPRSGATPDRAGTRWPRP